MARNSLEHMVEEYGMQLCKTHPQLKNRKMAHADVQTAAESSGLIFEAMRGNDRLDGPKGADVVLSVNYRSAGGTTREHEMVVDAIDETFGDDWIGAHIGQTMIESQFTWLQRQDEKEGDRNDTKNLRKRTRRIPFIAKA